MPLLKRADPLTIANVINAYWLGIAQVLPEPFEGNPEEFVIQKGQGTVALHKVLPQVVEVIRSNGGKLGEPKFYAEVMAELPALSGAAVIDGQRDHCLMVLSTGASARWPRDSVVTLAAGDWACLSRASFPAVGHDRTLNGCWSSAHVRYRRRASPRHRPSPRRAGPTSPRPEGPVQVGRVR